MPFFIAQAVEDKNGPINRGETGPGGGTCILQAVEDKTSPVNPGETGPGGGTCTFPFPLFQTHFSNFSGIVM
jgi:hypothetical protein